MKIVFDIVMLYLVYNAMKLLHESVNVIILLNLAYNMDILGFAIFNQSGVAWRTSRSKFDC